MRATLIEELQKQVGDRIDNNIYNIYDDNDIEIVLKTQNTLLKQENQFIEHDCNITTEKL